MRESKDIAKAKEKAATYTASKQRGNRQNRANGDDADFDGKLSRKAQKRKAALLRGSREPREPKHFALQALR